MKILFRENTVPAASRGIEKDRGLKKRNRHGMTLGHIFSQEKSSKNEISELVMRITKRTKYRSESEAIEKYHLNVPIGFRTTEGEKIASDWQTSTPLNDSVPSKKG